MLWSKDLPKPPGAKHPIRLYTRYIDRLLRRLRPHAQELVDAFGYEPEHVRAPIASGAEQARQDEAADYYARQAADGSAPIPEKVAKSGR